MSTNPPESSRALPDRPNLQHLKDQAKDLLKAGQADSLTDAQFRIARLYGFSSWPKLKAHVDSLQEVGSAEEIEQLKQAIDTELDEPEYEQLTPGGGITQINNVRLATGTATTT